MGIEKNKTFNFGALGLNDLKRYNIKKSIRKKIKYIIKKENVHYYISLENHTKQLKRILNHY